MSTLLKILVWHWIHNYPSILSVIFKRFCGLPTEIMDLSFFFFFNFQELLELSCLHLTRIWSQMELASVTWNLIHKGQWESMKEILVSFFFFFQSCGCLLSTGRMTVLLKCKSVHGSQSTRIFSAIFTHLFPALTLDSTRTCRKFVQLIYFQLCPYTVSSGYNFFCNSCKFL